ncbi:MAG: AbrB family transcriptional regulator [Moraxellaceae bacterium]|nr:MAG: AbrB family transcriptional regulator [Moraxellaceae bacterium]
MQLEIQKWGNSAALRLNKTILNQLSTAIGDKFRVEVKDGSILLTPIKDQPEYKLEDLLATCTVKNTRVDDDNWLSDDPVGKEIW